jgi:hypothetical protein
VAAVQQAEIFLVFKGRRKVKQVKRVGKVFNRVMKVRGFFRIVQYYKVVQLGAGRVIKNGAYDKLRQAAMQIFKVNPLRPGHGYPVRQLEKAGGFNYTFHQHVHIHLT